MPGTGDTPRARQLGAELRHARDEAGFGMRELAARLGISHTAVSHWESGRRAPSVEDLSGVLGVLGVTGEDREHLLKLARDAADPNWLAPGLDRHMGALMEYERTANLITNVEPLLVPGLLQTSDYARTIMRGAGATQGEAEQRVTLRVGRRDVLTRRKPVEFVAVIGEFALRNPPCDTEVMLDQLHELTKWQAMENVTIQVLPLAHHYSPALEGPFVLFEFERAKPVVQIEHYRSATTLTDARDVTDYKAAVDILRDNAMSAEETSALIAALMNEMEHTT
ncbi:helix-turn-helix domain-containing protein [Sciscionella marina]|uniref:helix-turn-helix domain-containing protein n=1 Tax=Sciscionella marina TaxID=508770 RepID=UPI000476FDE1|nr:helix-turn-helix transcriptional regulator [Sciscionella marina]